MAAQKVENWDDDIDIQGNILTHSLSTVKTSISSRLSLKSESNTGDDEWHVTLPAGDANATTKAIDSAKLAGIPLPSNVPASALVGGSIKRLGVKRTRANISNDDWGEDLELPQASAGKLVLKPPKVTEDLGDEDGFDDWAEGSSLGIRFGGTKSDAKNRTSSASAMSPSMGSVVTMESEEDGFGGLVLPTGPVNFQAALQKQTQSTAEHPAPAPDGTAKHSSRAQEPQDDFMEGIDFGTADTFDSKKRALHRNIKQNWKPTNTSSPITAKTQTTLTFGADKDKANTKIPRPIPTRSGRLEPVFEASTSHFARNRRHEATTTSAQLLRSKRSMPLLSRPDLTAQRPPLPTTTNRAPLKNYMKPTLHSRRESDPNRPGSPARPSSRLSATMTPDTPTRNRRDVAPISLAREAAAKRTVTRPARRRNFGDGSELEMFDDLPTSAAKESKFMKTATTRAPVTKMRSQPSIGRMVSREKMTTPQMNAPPPATPRSPTKAENLPRFARDTAASRIAREQKLGNTTPLTSVKSREGPLAPRLNWPAQTTIRSPNTSPSAHRTLRKVPTLINPMGKENIRHFQDDAAKKGMHWNATMFRWEGNDAILASFEPPPPPSPPRPALITNLAGNQGVQVVGGMVFDPTRMCWLKIGGGGQSNPGSPSVETEEDPFRDIPDLHDDLPSTGGGLTSAGGMSGGEWLVGEEFDLGPAFIARQREEEVHWRNRCNSWFEGRLDDGEAWKFAIRDIAAEAGT